MKHLLLALAVPLFAAQNDWDALLRISPAQETMVQTIDGKRHSGVFVSYTDDAIVIRTRKTFESFEKPRVKLITARLTPRSRSARTGAIVGGGLGLLFAFNLDGNGAGAVPTLASFGALTGACFNTMTTIYRKK